MIKIIIYTDKEKNISQLKVSGHAGYANKGEDIVCAGISALTYTLLNAMEALLGIKAKCDLKDGYVNYRLPDKLETEKQKDAQLVLKTIVLGFKNIRDTYKSFVEVFEEEV